MYTSAKTIFTLMENRFKPGTVLLFDEFFNYPNWQRGEYLAFQEFLETASLKAEFIGYNRNGEQVAVKLVS